MEVYVLVHHQTRASHTLHSKILNVEYYYSFAYSDVADGANSPGPVSSIKVEKISPTPTKTVATPLFQNLTNGNNNVIVINLCMHGYY